MSPIRRYQHALGVARLPRNDMVANGVVMLVAGGVALTGSAWPDIGTGLGIAALFGASAIEVIRIVRRGRHAVTAG